MQRLEQRVWGDEKIALDLVDIAKDSGADSIKFQIIDPEQVTDKDESYSYVKSKKNIYQLKRNV